MANVPRLLQISEESSIKSYRCLECSAEKQLNTNDWKYTYIWCNDCDEFMEHKCLELPPEGYMMPERWKISE